LTRRATVGLDLGAQSIKVAAIVTESRRQKVVALGCFPTDAPHGNEGSEGLEKGVLKQLSRWISENGLSGAKASLGIPMSQVTLKWISLPSMPAEDMAGAARAKVRRELPYPIDQAYVASTSLKSDRSRGSSDGADCVVMAAQKEAVRRSAAIAESLGLDPVHAEAEAQSFVRLVRQRFLDRTVGGAHASFTVVDLGHASTRMYVIQEGSLKFARSIRFGAVNFIHRAAQSLGISEEEADKLASSEGAILTSAGALRVPIAGDQASVAVDEELVVLTREITRLIRYFRSIFPARSFSAMMDSFVLSGGMSALPGLSQFVGNEVQSRVTLMDPFEHLDMSLPLASFRTSRTSPSRFSAAVGLALAAQEAPIREEIENGYLWARTA
jgi:type IV pilus assembly protein PilM